MNTVAKASELHEDAQLVIEVISEKEDVRLDFSADSVLWLDTYIDQHRAKLNEGDKTVLREKLGAFLGETIPPSLWRAVGQGKRESLDDRL